MTTPQWRPVGSIRGARGPAGLSWEVLPFAMHGDLHVASGSGRFPIKGGTFAVETVTAAVESAPVGAPVVVDVLANGASIYAEADDRPTIAPLTNTSVEADHVPTYVTDGDYLNVDVVAVGTIQTGRFLTVVIRLRQVEPLDAT